MYYTPMTVPVFTRFKNLDTQKYETKKDYNT